MADFLHLNLTNAILPLAVLVVICIALPAVLAGETLSHRTLTAAMLVTALVVWVVGGAIMAWLYSQVNGQGIGPLWPYFRRSGLLGLLWGPVLALVWLMRAQGVERRRGLAMGRGGT